MRTWTTMARAFVMAGLLTTSLPACDGAGADDGTTAGEDEYTEAIPDEEMLAVALTEEATATGALELDVATGALESDPASIRGYAEEVAERVRTLVATTHDQIETLLADVEPVDVQLGGLRCKVWEADGPNNHWKLRSCRKGEAAKRFGFVLEGRPLAATEEADYLVVVAGEGQALPRHDGKRRGHGRIGYDFDNRHTLLGDGPTGKVAIGYRAAGRFRSLTVGLRDFQAVEMEQAVSALYRFRHIVGTGGALTFRIAADFVTADADGTLAFGKDGTAEVGRARVLWTRDGRARVALAACGGTVGDEACVRMHQCWSRAGDVSFADVVEGEAPVWEEAVCPADAELAEPDAEPPTEEDVTLPAADDLGDVPGPAVEEPAAVPGEEAAE